MAKQPPASSAAIFSRTWWIITIRRVLVLLLCVLLGGTGLAVWLGQRAGKADTAARPAGDAASSAMPAATAASQASVASSQVSAAPALPAVFASSTAHTSVRALQANSTSAKASVPASPTQAQQPASIATPSAQDLADLQTLAARRLQIPVQGVQAHQLANTYDDARAAGARRHDAIDIMAAAGTPVLAVEGGRIVKLYNSAAGGITIYQFDPQERFGYYYAHLQSYAPGLQEGMQVKRGDVIGTVGSSGNANPLAPHLHFAVFRLNAQKQWWKGEYLNPYHLWR